MFMAYIVMAYMFMAYIVMAYMFMAYIVMAFLRPLTLATMDFFSAAAFRGAARGQPRRPRCLGGPDAAPAPMPRRPRCRGGGATVRERQNHRRYPSDALRGMPTADAEGPDRVGL